MRFLTVAIALIIGNILYALIKEEEIPTERIYFQSIAVMLCWLSTYINI